LKKNKESNFKLFLKELFKNQAFVGKITERFKSGIPDIFIIRNGFIYWIEAKVQSRKLTEIQRETLARMASHGALTFLVDRTVDKEENEIITLFWVDENKKQHELNWNEFFLSIKAGKEVKVWNMLKVQ